MATTWVFQGLAYGPLLPGMCMITNKKSHPLVGPMSIIEYNGKTMYDITSSCVENKHRD